MMAEWQEIAIADFCEVTDYVANGSFASLKENVTYRDSPDYAVLVRFTDHTSGWNGNYVYVDKSSYDFLRKSSLQPNDLVISNVGANAGTAFLVPDLKQPMTLGPNAVVLKTDNQKYLYYYFISPDGNTRLKSILSGSAQPKFNKTDLRRLKVTLPPLPEQQAIAEVLSALDEKIELNRRMNATLEAMARALFKSWFVDFDPVRAKMEGRAPDGLSADIAALLPDTLVESSLGEIPKGWEVREISDCCNQVMNGSTPSRKEPLYWENGNIPWLTSGEVRQTIILEPENRITQLGFKKSSVKLVPAFSTVVALYGATAGQVSLIASEMTTNQAICALVPKDFFKFYNYLNISTQVRHLEQQARGSAQQNLSKGIVEKTRVIVPKDEILRNFEDVVTPFFTRWIENLRENQTLSQLRDTLLPKLISGQLRVTDTASSIKEAV